MELASPTEQLVEVADLHGDFLQTRDKKLVAILEMHPVMLANGSTPEGMNGAFADVIQVLPAGIDMQITSMPVPPQLGSITERYARAAHSWRTQEGDLLAAGQEEAAQAAIERYRAAAGIGGMILDVGGRANYRATLITLTLDLPFDQQNSEQFSRQQLGEFEADIRQITTLFGESGFQLSQLPAEVALHYLWHCYNPDSNVEAVADQTSERFLDIAQHGKTDLQAHAGLSVEQITRTLNNPTKELAGLLAPTVVEEGERNLQFHKKSMLLYFIVDYRHQLPRLADLQGRGREYANNLFLSYYLHVPPADEIAEMTNRAGTGLKTMETLRSKWSDKRNYRAENEYGALEAARAGAETKYDVMRMVGLYVGVLVDTDAIEEEEPKFEAVLRAAGLTFVPAQWNAMKVWKSLHPLGQRHHKFEDDDRNVYSANLGNLNPLSGVTLFDPQGEFLGFSPVGRGVWSPVAVQRKRGTSIASSDALVGRPGSGKSFALKQWITDWVVRGHRVFALDPKTELGPLGKRLGGTTVDALGATGFNIFRFANFPVDPNSKMGMALREMVLEDNLNALETLYLIAKGVNSTLGGDERSILIDAMTMAMNDKDMHPEDTRTWKPNGLLLADVYEVMARSLLHEDPMLVANMQKILKPYAVPGGLYFKKYNTPVEMDLDSELVAITFGLSQFSSDRRKTALAYHFALRLTMQQALRSFILSEEEHPRPFHIVIDEASQMLVTASLISSVVRMLSILPAYDIFVHLAFQDFKALMRTDSITIGEESDSLNTLVGTIPAFWLFNQQYESALVGCQALNLEAEEANQIKKLSVGSCLLVFPQADIRLRIQIESPAEMQGLYETDATSMKTMLQEAMVDK
ncbi:MAG: hypothetical protein DWQ07_17860 [Chloroflexi bacterium]|nr:MAG: hypothetical protein DWQ07_17860 [Chloroflexota bacterium]